MVTMIMTDTFCLLNGPEVYALSINVTILATTEFSTYMDCGLIGKWDIPKTVKKCFFKNTISTITSKKTSTNIGTATIIPTSPLFLMNWKNTELVGEWIMAPGLTWILALKSGMISTILKMNFLN